jgi:hypothetical protein
MFLSPWPVQVLPPVGIMTSSMLPRFLTALVASKPERDKNVIDLTGDDEKVELRRAVHASLSPSYGPHGSQFGPSDRAPDPNWAMVPSNVGTVSLSRDTDGHLFHH